MAGAVAFTDIGRRSRDRAYYVSLVMIKSMSQAPALINTTSEIEPGVAVPTEKEAPCATTAGEAVIAGRDLKKYEGR